MFENFLISGYTRRLNTGIATIKLDRSSQRFHERHVIAELQNPTYLTLSNDGQFLFAIEKNEPQSGLTVFQKDGEEWIRMSQSYPSQIPACHLSYRPQTRTIYASNYHEGAIEVYQLDDSHQLQPLQQIYHTGSSIHPNQSQARIHFTSCLDSEDLLYACDLGSDLLYIYQLDQEGKLSQKIQKVQMPAGMGPRHLIKHPSLPYVYIVGELDNTTARCQIDSLGLLHYIESTDNLKNASDQASAAAIRISKDGHYLYVSTRYDDMLTVFSIGENDGRLHKIQEIHSIGKVPRDFILNQAEDYLLCAHQDSDYISLFKRDPQTGLLNFLHNEAFAPECVCILEIPQLTD